jgi:elongation factor P--(R)-beta-lysine ligase
VGVLRTRHCGSFGPALKARSGEHHVKVQPSPFWHPTRHADRRPFLLGRARIKAALRDWFAAQGFVEVETACLQVSPGNEAHLHAFETEQIGQDLARTPLYLHTSPEFAMKKLLAAGEERIFTLAPCFRNREAGALHAREFTMLEWYRAGTGYDAMMTVSHRGRTCDPAAPPERVTLAQAFGRHAGVDLMAAIGDRDALAGAAQAQGIRVGCDYTWSDIFARILTERVEPALGVGRATFLCDYPASEAALARPSAADLRVAERFELYVCGVEIANGFSELTDPAIQRRNLEAEMALKQARYGERYPIDDDFIAALAHVPDAAGCALGFDRLVMLATGADRLDQVQWTPMG